MPLLKKRVWWDGIPKVVSRVLRPLDPMVVKWRGMDGKKEGIRRV